MSYPPLTDSEFEELVLGSELSAVIYVTASCCRVDELARREFQAVAAEFQDQIAIVEVDAGAKKALVSRLNVKAVPALLVFASGTEVAALIGFHHRDELRNRLWSIISNSG